MLLRRGWSRPWRRGRRRGGPGICLRGWGGGGQGIIRDGRGRGECSTARAVPDACAGRAICSTEGKRRGTFVADGSGPVAAGCAGSPASLHLYDETIAFYSSSEQNSFLQLLGIRINLFAGQSGRSRPPPWLLGAALAALAGRDRPPPWQFTVRGRL